MGLRLKFNLVLILVFVIGLGVAGFMSYELLHKNAQDEVLRNAGVMMEAALSMRGYTVGKVRPLLPYDPDKFLPESVPAFAATEIMHLLQKKYPDYSYKEAAFNPTNPRNKAVDWESDILKTFRSGGPLKEISGGRDTPTGRALYPARPPARRAPSFPGAAAPDPRRGLPQLPHQSRDGAAGDGEALWPGARLRLGDERGDCGADCVGAHGPADPQRQPRVRHLHELGRGGVHRALRAAQRD